VSDARSTLYQDLFGLDGLLTEEEREVRERVRLPAGDDGLTGRVAAGVVVVPAIRAAFGFAARP
jgi:hypothetical protein